MRYAAKAKIYKISLYGITIVDISQYSITVLMMKSEIANK